MYDFKEKMRVKYTRDFVNRIGWVKGVPKVGIVRKVCNPQMVSVQWEGNLYEVLVRTDNLMPADDLPN